MNFIKRVEAINNQTENKNAMLEEALNEYVNYCNSIPNFTGFPLTLQLKTLISARTKRKNVGPSYLHKQFLRVKKDALEKMHHNRSLLGI